MPFCGQLVRSWPQFRLQIPPHGGLQGSIFMCVFLPLSLSLSFSFSFSLSLSACAYVYWPLSFLSLSLSLSLFLTLCVTGINVYIYIIRQTSRPSTTMGTIRCETCGKQYYGICGCYKLAFSQLSTGQVNVCCIGVRILADISRVGFAGCSFSFAGIMNGRQIALGCSIGQTLTHVVFARAQSLMFLRIAISHRRRCGFEIC